MNIRMCNCLKDGVDKREAGYDLKLKLTTKCGTMTEEFLEHLSKKQENQACLKVI